jgi:Domain of unknown function (DUF4281)
MTPELLFSLSGPVALIGWLSLAAGILLRNALLRDTVVGTAIPLALSAAYAALILVFWWTAEGGFDSLANVQKLFNSPWVALAGWVHYLAFDLAIGAILARKVMAAGLSRLFLIPILPLTFLFGPIGFLLGQAVLLSRKEA